MTEVYLPDTGTVEVVLELDPPVKVVANTSVTLYSSASWRVRMQPDTSVVANEHWDDPLPLRGWQSPFWDWYRGLRSSADGQLALYDLDSVEKRISLLSWLDEADYIVLSSNCLYASIPRLPRAILSQLRTTTHCSMESGFRAGGRVRPIPRPRALPVS